MVSSHREEREPSLSRKNSGKPASRDGKSPTSTIVLALALIAIFATVALAENGQLSITAQLTSSPVFLTNTTQLLIRVNNTGDVNLTNITLEDRFLSALFNLSGFSEAPSSNSTGIVRLSGLGNSSALPLAPNQTLTLLLNYTPLANDTLASHSINASAFGLFNATGNLTILTIVSNSTVLSTPILGDAFEPDNNFTQARNLSLDGSSQIHTFSPSGDQDWLVFTARAGSTYDISANNITSFLNNSQSFTDVFLTLLNSSLSTIQSHDDNFLGVDLNARIIWTATTSGTYFIRVTETSGSPAGPGGTYEIRVTERGRLGPTAFAMDKTTVVPRETFTVNTTFRCSQGRCVDVVLTLDPEESGTSPGVESKNKNAADEPTTIESTISKQGNARVIIKTKGNDVKFDAPKSKIGPSSINSASLTRSSDRLTSVASSTPRGRLQDQHLMPAIGMLTATITASELDSLRSNPEVEEIYLDVPVRAFLNASGPKIRSDVATNITINGRPLDGSGIGVCVIDSGISYNHTDFGNCTLAQVQGGTCEAVQSGFDFVNNDNDPLDDNGHGSHVAGTIASRDATFKGIAPRSSILGIKALDATGVGSSSNIIAGINWCITNATRYNISVITMSLGDTTRSMSSCDRFNPFAAAVNNAVKAGILVSVASGNDGFGTAANDGISSPACVTNATSVGSTITNTDAISSFTNRGLNLDLLAPGQFITSTQHNTTGGHIPLQGTSMAAPHVSGAAALVYHATRLSYNRTPLPLEVQQLLQTTGVVVNDSGASGPRFPRIDAKNAVSAKGVVPMTPGATPFWTPSTNPVSCGALSENQTCFASWIVNASNVTGSFEFFAIASQEFDMNMTGRTNVTIQSVPPAIIITTIASPQRVNMSDRVNFSINVTNSAKTTIVNATLSLAFNASDLLFISASPAPTSNTSGVLTWVNPFLALAPNASFFINSTFIALNRSTSLNSTVTIAANATDGALPASAGSSTTIEILFFNGAPVFTTSPPTVGTIGVAYNYDANASDPNGDTLTFNLTRFPFGMSINTSTGLVSWTPLANQSGINNVTITVSDPGNLSATQNFTINVTAVNLAPNITSTPVISGTEDVAYSYTVTATDPENGTLTFVLVTAPSGLTINNATGAIAWTPLNNQVGVNPVRVNATDTSGNAATQQFNITVTNALPAFTTSPGVSSVVATTAFLYDTNSSDDGQGNITYTLSSAPVGVIVNNASGLVTWVPAAFQIGSHNITVVVDDGNGGVVLQKFGINVTTPFSFSILGPSTVNMSGRANYTLLGRNTGNATLHNFSLQIRFNSTDYSIDSAGAIIVNGTQFIQGNITPGIGVIFSDNAANLTPQGNASLTVSLVVLNRTGNVSSLVSGLGNASSNGTTLVDNFTIVTNISFFNFAPVFTSTPPTTGVTTIPYGYDADAVDGNGDSLNFSLVIFPSGMTINASTGVVNFTPTLFQNGLINVTLNVSDGKGGVAIQSYILNLTRFNSPPNVTTTPPVNATEDSAFSYDINATDGENDTLSFVLDILPGGMTINSGTGLIAWTPNNTQVGNATVRVNISDGQGNLTTHTFSLVVINNPPAFTTTAPTTAVQGVAYSYDANSNDDGQGNITYVLTVSLAGMSVNASTGVVSWIPALNQVGLNNYSLRVLDGNAGSAEQNVTVNVSNALISAVSAIPNPISMNQPVVIRFNATSVGGRTLSNLTLGVSFNTTDLIFLNATPGLSVNASNGSLAFGNLSINLGSGQTGVVTITFLTANRSVSANTTLLGLFNASDNGTIIGSNTSQVIEISFANFAPQITSSPITVATNNTNYSYDVDAVDGNGDALTFNLTAFPGGMTINSTTGLITFFANKTGNSTVTIVVDDGRGASATQNFTLEVRTVNRAPNITTVPVLTATEDTLYSYDVNASDLDGDVVTFALVSGPSGMTINAATGAITFVPLNTHVGTSVVTLRASDPFGSADNQSFTLLILNNPPVFNTTPPLTVVERGNFSYDANSSDDGQGTITYTLDLAPNGMSVNATSGVVNWTPLTTQVGLNNVSLRVTDGNGGSAVQNFTINVTDLTPPNVTLLAPANASVFNVSTINVTFAVSDNGGIASCLVRVNATSTTVFSASGSFNKSQTIIGSVSLLQGTNNISVTCSDTSALSNTSNSVLVFSDSTAPVVSISSPLNGQNVTGNISVTFSASDATLDKVQILFNGAVVNASAGASGTFVIASPVEGIGQNITVIANDSVGLTGNATVRVNVDRTAPAAALGTNASVPIFGTRGALVFATSINSSDSGGISTSVFDFDAADGIGNVDATGANTTKNYTGPGRFVVTLTVMDPSGNTARTNATVTVARDSDGDGFVDEAATGLIVDTCPLVFNSSNNPLACVGDTDGDGINDTVDFIFGNATQIMGNVPGLSLIVNGATNPLTASGVSNITIQSSGTTLLTFSFNLTNVSRLIVPNITILRQTGGILIAGLPSPINKTVVLPKDVSSHNAVCIKDTTAQSFAEISTTCLGSLEIQVNCTGAAQGKTCTDTGSAFSVTNLANTIITSFTAAGAGSGSSGSSSSGTLVNNGTALVTEGSSGSGGSFDVPRGSSSGSTLSSSFTPSSSGAVDVPSTTPASSTEKAPTVDTVVVIENPLAAAAIPENAQTVPAVAEPDYRVSGSSGSAGTIPTSVFVLAGLVMIAILVAMVAVLVWALRG